MTLNESASVDPGRRLEGEIAIVTGGEGGIGSAIVALFATQGARVVSADALAKPPADSVSVRDDNVAYHQVDVSSEADVERFYGAVTESIGAPTILVNCAAVLGSPTPAHEVTEDEFDRLFRVNVKGTWLMTKHALPHMMAAKRGSIVNFSSIAGVVGGTSRQAIYHSTKGAIRAMSKADAVAYAPHGVRVNSVYPGSISTRMAEETALNSPLGYEEHVRAISAKHPLGRRGLPEEVAQGVLFLASSEASFITGAELGIDGGYTAQ